MINRYLLFFILTILSHPSFAQQKEGLTLGVGTIYRPLFEGSEDYRVLPVPFLQTNYWRISLGVPFATFRVFGDPAFEMGIIGRLDSGRVDYKDDTLWFPKSGSDHLEGMGKVKKTFEPGIYARTNIFGLITLGANVRKGTGGHTSIMADANLGILIPISQMIVFRLGGIVTYAGREYMQNYFGVTAEQEAATDFAAYTPEAGIKNYNTSITMIVRMSENWKIHLTHSYSKLLNDAAESPILQRTNNITSSAFMMYEF